MKPLRALCLALIAAAFSLGPGKAEAQSWPLRPLRIVVVYPPGGTSDAIARPLAEKLASALGQPVVVENRGGAGGSLGMEAMARSTDGHTFAFSAISPLTLLPHVGKVPYDPLKDVAAVASVMYSPVYVLGTPAFSGRDFPAAIAQAKSQPGQLRLATSGIATLGHLMLEQVKAAAGVDIVHVPYKGGGQVIADAASGQFELFTANPSPGVNALVQQGRLRILAVAAPQRLAALPAVPTLTELGYPDSNMTSLFGVFAPGQTPEPVVRRMNAEINRALLAPDMAERLAKLDNIALAASTESLASTIRREHAANARVVARAGIRLD